ncbi:carbohydrate kinase family protein [Acidothermaceae bacterium B102]|nr:carbohydrate kinase family protein [Acidothermaceae bacterium B102]
MPVIVTGSFATDHLMTFPGRFADQLLPDQLHRVSLSFLVDHLDIRRGGVAANISFGMAALGETPVIVAAAGSDCAEYRGWLDDHGVDTASLHVSTTAHTARFLCTTDLDNNQIASFYPGAMSEAGDIALGPVVERLGGAAEVSLILISPDDPAGMLRHTQEARDLGIAFVADPSQQLARMEGPEVRQLVEGARFLFTNDYEWGLITTKTGWSHEDILDKVDVWVVTHGAKGSVIHRKGQDDLAVPVAQEMHIADPTGVGDAFRSGFLTGVAWGIDLERSAQVGSMLATYVLETVGTQEYVLDKADFIDRFAESYGADAAAEVRGHLLPA